MKKLVLIIIVMGLGLSAYLFFLNIQEVKIESENDNIIIRVYSHGGLCPWGDCNETTIVNTDSSYLVTSKRESGIETINSGSVSTITIKELQALI
ncbi:MAG: hypothetical protein V1853_03880 [bacterium]